MAQRILSSSSAIALVVCSACGLFDFDRPRLREGAGGAAGQPSFGGMLNAQGGSGEAGSGGEAATMGGANGGVSGSASSGGGEPGGDAGSERGGAASSSGGAGTNGFSSGGLIGASGATANSGGLGAALGGTNSGGRPFTATGGSASGGVSGALGGTANFGGVGGSAGEGCASWSTFPAPESIVRDDFAGTSLDPRWKNLNASSSQKYSVSDGHLSSSAGIDDAMFWSEKQGANQEAYARILSFDPLLYGTVLLLKANRQDVQRFAISIYYAEDFNGGYYLGIEVQNGGWKDVYYRNDVRLMPGQVLGGRAFANGCVQAFIDGTLVAQRDISKDGVSPADYGAASSYVGFGNVLNRENTEPTVWDYFGAGTIPPSSSP